MDGPKDPPTPTLTPIPTSTLIPLSATPYPTPHPLTKEAIASCPVSLPNLDKSPDPYFISVEDGYGNPQRTIFIGLWPGGTIFFQPKSAGMINPDGSLGMKFWFYRTIPGDVVFGGRRLDAPAPPMPTEILRGEEDGYGETGFQPAGLTFSTEGCWEVTASIGEESMTFVTLVVRYPFERLWLFSLPEGRMDPSYDISGYPDSIRYVYRYPGRGEVIAEISQDKVRFSDMYPKAMQELTGRMMGQPATCVQGALDAQGEWQTGVDATTLYWTVNGLSYRLSQTGLEQSCFDLLRFIGQPPN